MEVKQGFRIALCDFLPVMLFLAFYLQNTIVQMEIINFGRKNRGNLREEIFPLTDLEIKSIFSNSRSSLVAK